MARRPHQMVNAPRTTRESLRLLEEVPQRPRPLKHPANWPLALQSVADFVTHAPAWLAKLRGHVLRYPRPFEKVSVRSRDGTLLSAWLGVHTFAGSETVQGSRGPAEPREGIILLPGMFSSKDNILLKARALKVFRDLGYHVLAMDLRGFGESSRVPNTAGWKESEDVAAAVRFFRKTVPVTKVHIYAESLGASAALIAAGKAGRSGKPLIDGSLMAVSPFADASAEARHISTRPALTQDFFMVQWFFKQLLRLGGAESHDFVGYLKGAAKHYGLPLATLFRRASPVHWLGDIDVPTLILWSADDPIVPADQGAIFEKALARSENPVFWKLPWGSHCLYEMADPTWFWTVVKEFFDFYCILPPAPGREAPKQRF